MIVFPEIVHTNKRQAVSFSQLENSISMAGFYELTDGQDFEEWIGLNYSREESEITSMSAQDIANQFAAIGWKSAQKFETGDSGAVQINQLKATEYWRILLILGLIFIAIEILLLKLWKS